MKKFTFLLAFTTAVTALFGQSLPKKYVFLEHFTNSPCPICASKNPAFYSLIHQYPDDVRHLAVYTPVPYSSCKIYQANPTDNGARTNYYGINGSPRVALNGTLVPVGTPMLPAATLQSALGQTSPIAIRVQEGGSYPNKIANITITTYGNVPAGNYKLYAAVAESTVDYNAPNGETKHYDVFRAMLPNASGADITLPAPGSSATYTYSYTYTAPNGWASNYDSLYVLAFVQNATTKEVLNAGTRFDPVFTGTGEAVAPQSITIQPNPVAETAWVSLPGQQAERVEVFSIGGNLVRTAYDTQNEQVQIPVESLTPGIYVVKITTGEGIYVGKMVKE